MAKVETKQRGRLFPPAESRGQRAQNDDYSIPKELLQSVNDAAHTVRNGWVFFLALMAFFFVAVAGVTHTELLLNAPVSLPIVEVKIELNRFFQFAPLVLVLVHFAILLQYAMLARKTHALDLLLARSEKPGAARTHPLRLQLSSYFFVQAMAGPARSPVLGAFLRAMSWLTLGLLPLVLLLFFQISYLPYHDHGVTWAHRFYLLADFVVLLSIGIFTRFPDQSFRAALWTNLRNHSLNVFLTIALRLAALIFAFGVATIPDSSLDYGATALSKPIGLAVPVPYGDEPYKTKRRAFWLTAWLFEGRPDAVSGRASSWFSRNLIVTDADLVPYVDEKQEEANEVSLRLRGRDLRYASFDHSDLHRADLTGAKLQQASFSRTNLVKARMADAALQGVNLYKANLQGVNLYKANLQGVNLHKANLQGANLRNANFQGGNLYKANLQGADLRNANLRGVDLYKANLQGADLAEAKLQGANLHKAKLQGANLRKAMLQRADLRSASLQGADLRSASLQGADLRKAKIWQTAPPESSFFKLADLRNAKMGAIGPKDLKQSLGTLLEAIPNRDRKEGARIRLTPLFDAAKVKAWEASDDHKAWANLIAAGKPPDDGKFRTKLADELADLACEDSTDKAWVAQAIVKRGAKDLVFKTYRTFNGDTARLYKRLTAKDCAPRKKIPASLLTKLKYAAEEYAKKHPPVKPQPTPQAAQ